jgi:hypothetical protein
MKFDEKLLSWYWYFINERHAIYLRRERGDEWPWTDDEILMTYKFTNIFRELDTGTIWLRENIREPYALHPELFFNIAMYRLYNYIPTAAEIMEKIGFIENAWQLDDVVKLVYARQKRGERIFTGAHMITGTLGGDKVHQVFELCLGELWKNRKALEPRNIDNLKMSFNRLNKHNPGYGPFISYEVITDLRHTRYLQDANDIMMWANAGPGAMRGICRLLGLKVKTMKGGVPSLEIRHQYPSKEEYIKYMRALLSTSDDTLEKWLPNLEMRDIEHSLCEWDKYERVRNGEGRPRSKYVPPQLRQQV